jgi:hypothetical protein
MDALWYNYDLTEPRDTVKCIKQLERVCRDSLEYDDWQKKCKYKDALICPICNDDYYENNSKCESHHHPKTLFDIVEEVLEDHLEKNDLDEMTGLSIVQEIMDLHLFKKVSYINLCQHCHKKYHAGHPEVAGKMALIFEKRVKEEMDKEVDEEVEEVIITSIPVPDDIDIEFNQINIVSPVSNGTVHHTNLKDDEHKVIFTDAEGKEQPFPKVPPAPSIKETPKPDTLNVETTQGFISIDIDNL